MKKDLEYYLNLPYEIILKKLSKQEGGGYFASYKDFPYIMGDGESEIEALEDVKEAFKGAIALMLEKKDKIKEPNEDKRVRINITISSKLLEEIDKTTHNRSQFLSDCAYRALHLNS
ncbi:HicB family protein [Helicobacter valdiviensis]|uniref:HicB family protein n=1 Tax=Helicobacter valdiviensis TaxID=1458358 RepID=A0A2W6MUP4_9HELI|nr:type II toxin-antitoxin system HicB family antitoxin [Helicobacter valdiviensis]PZT48187.1 HicB family protein [Helicobacter valdiviensis]